MINSKNLIILMLGVGIVFLVFAIPTAFVIGMQIQDRNAVITPTDTPPIPVNLNDPTATPQQALGSISGRVWHDLCVFTAVSSHSNLPTLGCTYTGEENGYRANAILENGEPGISGIFVTLGSGTCPSYGLSSTTTNQDGVFSFAGLVSGTYCIGIDPSVGSNSPILNPGGWTKPSQNASASLASYTITLPEGQNLGGVDFGWDYLNLPVLPPTPTKIPVPTNTPVPKTANQTICNWAQFVSDITVQDGAVFPAGATFTKIWRIKNIGTCTWTTDFDLVFIGGEPMTSKTVVALPRGVVPNESVDVSVTMTAPKNPGTYKGNWMLRTDSGSYFGIGSKADKPVWVQITVINTNANYGLDFAASMCTAEWRSATKTLACPSSSTSADGFVQLLTNPKLEHRREDEPTLWTHPNNKSDGWISGTYPAYTVKQNDHFRAQIGCLEGSTGCNVLFRLQYREGNGPVVNVKKWAEVYDGQATEVKLDLSDLAGKKVRFILTVEVRGGDPAKANAFWFVPRIQYIAPPPSPPPTATPDHTITPAAQAARTILALDLGISVDDVIITSAEAVEWTTTCMGFYIPSTVCVPEVIPGYRVWMTYGGHIYEAHTNGDGTVVYWILVS
jgi:hypothetical protein